MISTSPSPQQRMDSARNAVGVILGQIEDGEASVAAMGAIQSALGFIVDRGGRDAQRVPQPWLDAAHALNDEVLQWMAPHAMAALGAGEEGETLSSTIPSAIRDLATRFVSVHDQLKS